MKDSIKLFGTFFLILAAFLAYRLFFTKGLNMGQELSGLAILFVVVILALVFGTLRLVGSIFSSKTAQKEQEVVTTVKIDQTPKQKVTLSKKTLLALVALIFGFIILAFV